MNIDAEKTAFNARAKSAMEKYLQSKSWVEKVQSIERMNAFDKIAKAAMKKTLADEAKSNASGGTNPCE
jgi:hypothetical protein